MMISGDGRYWSGASFRPSFVADRRLSAI